MKKKVYITIFLINIAVLISYCVCSIGTYILRQKQNERMIEYCFQNDTKECYIRMFEQMLPKLLFNKVTKNKKEIEYLKIANSDPLWQAFPAFYLSDIFINYVQYKKSNFQKDYPDYTFGASEIMELESYEFEGKESNSDKKITDELFSTLDILQNANKKIVINLILDEFDKNIIERLLKYSDIILEFNVFAKFKNSKEIIEFICMTNIINNDYILVSRNSMTELGTKVDLIDKYYEGPIYNAIFALSFLNKCIIDDYSISMQQRTNKFFIGEKVRWYSSDKTQKTSIHHCVIWTEKIKELFKMI